MPPITIRLGERHVEAMRLADALQQLGKELGEAQRRAQEDPTPDLLKVKDCTVELAVTWERKGEAGIEWHVIKLGGGVSKSDVTTISVTLEPTTEIKPALNP